MARIAVVVLAMVGGSIGWFGAIVLFGRFDPPPEWFLPWIFGGAAAGILVGTLVGGLAAARTGHPPRWLSAARTAVRRLREGPGVRPTAALAAANLVPLVGVVAFGWNVALVLAGYWVETGVVGATVLAKTRRAQGEADPAALPDLTLDGDPIESFAGTPKRELRRWFRRHFGAWWTGAGAVVAAIVVVVGVGEGTLASNLLVVAGVAGAPVAYHLASYRLRYLGGREYERQNPVALLVDPYRRAVVLNATLLVGGFYLFVFGTPLPLVLVLVVIKTYVDIWLELQRYHSAG